MEKTYFINSVHISAFRVIRVLFLMLILSACGRNYTPEQKAYIAKIEKERTRKNDWMKNDSSSPFNFKGKIEFHDLKYFDVDPDTARKIPLLFTAQRVNREKLSVTVMLYLKEMTVI